MPELFDIVDSADRVVGTASRDEVHGDPALIHRVAHVLVFNPTGMLYLQKRAENKDVQPGKWDTSVGGHVDSGETYDAAAHREMSEELGIAGIRLRRLYRYLHSNDYESEMVTSYKATWDGPVNHDPGEIAEGRFWSLDEIHSADAELFTPNFMEELDRYERWATEPEGT